MTTRRALIAMLLLVSFGSLSSGAAGRKSQNRPTEREVWARTELYFGSEKPDGSRISEAEFMQFVDREVRPKFPDGLTVLTGYGQFRSAEGIIVRERSAVLILLYPAQSAENDAKIQEIREAYKRLFHQESVLRVDSFSLVSF